MNKTAIKTINVISGIIVLFSFFILAFGNKTGERGMIVIILIPLLIVFIPILIWGLKKGRKM